MPAQVRPVEQFYRVRFPDYRDLHAWMRRVLDHAAVAEEAKAWDDRPRPVIFVPLMAHREPAAFAYVSEGARSLALTLGRGVEVGEGVVAIRDLPDGLTLLYGEGADAESYMSRRRDA